MARKPKKTNDELSLLRLLTILAILVLFIADYGFDVLAKPVPNLVYLALAAIALGIDIKYLRDLLAAFLRAQAGLSNESRNGKDDEEDK